MSPRLKWTLLVAVGVIVPVLLLGPWACLPMAMLVALVVGTDERARRLFQPWSGAAATPGASALGFALLANGIAVAVTMLNFLLFPTGDWGRPMALTAFYFLFALVMTPLGIGKSVRAWSQEKPLAISAMILSLAILPVELLTFFALASAKAFELAP